MTGYHLVSTFPFEDEETRLPEGWKPFGVAVINGVNHIVARKWVRENRQRSTLQALTTVMGEPTAIATRRV